MASQNLQAGCGWMLVFDPAQTGLGNNAYPDTNARYSALHVHNGNLFVLDALSANELVPDPGSANRNLDRTRRDDGIAFGGAYTAYVRINAAAPAVRETNTLYRPAPGLLDAKVKKRTALAYRTYLPIGGNERGVPLPGRRSRRRPVPGPCPMRPTPRSAPRSSSSSGKTARPCRCR